jgi:hypothetical protein
LAKAGGSFLRATRFSFWIRDHRLFVKRPASLGQKMKSFSKKMKNFLKKMLNFLKKLSISSSKDEHLFCVTPATPQILPSWAGTRPAPIINFSNIK